MNTKRTIGIAVTFLAVVALASCSGSDASPSATVSSPAHELAGSFVREGHPGDVLVLDVDGGFCLSQDGHTFDGSYRLDGGDLRLQPDVESLPEEVGTVEGDVITDPEGERWTRSEDAPGCAPLAAVPPGDQPQPETDAIVVAIEGTHWPTAYATAVDSLDRLPTRIGGYRSDRVQRSPGAAALEYPDPSYVGPVSGISIVVVPVPNDLTATQLVDATAHIGFSLRAETKRFGETDDVPIIVGRIDAVEGAGSLPEGHTGYLAVWAMRDGRVVFAVIADTATGLGEAVDDLIAATARTEG